MLLQKPPFLITTTLLINVSAKLIQILKHSKKVTKFPNLHAINDYFVNNFKKY